MSESHVVRVVGRYSLTALMVGGIIGSGIFGVPAKIASFTGSQSPIAWMLAAAGISVIAACFAEVASSFTVSGGPYIYARAAFGNFAGLQTAWLTWLSRLFSVAAAANLFTAYVLELLPSLNRPYLRALPITLFMALVITINVRGIRMGVNVFNSLTVLKVGLILVFVVAGCAFLFLHGSPLRLVREAHSSNDWLNSILLAVFAYTGFEAALIPAGEARNPDRDAPIATLVALAVCTPIYCLVQFVVVQTVANPAASDRPLAAAALVFGGHLLAKEIVLAVLVSVTGFLTGALIVTPRITFAMAEQGDFPRWFAAVHPRFKSPYISIVSFGVLVWALTILGTFSWNAKFSVLSRLFTYAIICASLPMLRHKKPGMARFKLPGGVLFATLGVGFCALLLSRIGRIEIAALAIVFAVVLVNWIAIRRRDRQSDSETETSGLSIKVTAE
jgi:amino acid transporter